MLNCIWQQASVLLFGLLYLFWQLIPLILNQRIVRLYLLINVGSEWLGEVRESHSTIQLFIQMWILV